MPMWQSLGVGKVIAPSRNFVSFCTRQGAAAKHA
jgi:hypothetical protein